jgi:FkbM family methyltransferase
MSKGWRTRQLDATEIALVAVLVTVIGAALVSSRYAQRSWSADSAAQESARLKDLYGPARHSENEEEWIIRDYFQDRRGGTFVDVGANHYKDYSNTFYLEAALGWSGIAVDPQVGFAADYRTYRPRTRFFSFFVSDTSDANITFHVTQGNPLVSSADQGFAERAGRDVKDPVYTSNAVSVPTIRLSDLLDRAGVSHFDLLSVDVELAEPKVLAGFDIARFRPSLVCIEAHPQVRQQILDYFAAHGYVVLGRYLRADLANLYFGPVGLTRPTPPTVPGTVPDTATQK